MQQRGSAALYINCFIFKGTSIKCFIEILGIVYSRFLCGWRE